MPGDTKVWGHQGLGSSRFGDNVAWGHGLILHVGCDPMSPSCVHVPGLMWCQGITPQEVLLTHGQMCPALWAPMDVWGPGGGRAFWVVPALAQGVSSPEPKFLPEWVLLPQNWIPLGVPLLEDLGWHFGDSFCNTAP